MAMTRGTVTVGDDEAASGSGFALDLYNEIFAVETAANPLPGLTPPDDWPLQAQDWVDKVKPIRLRILRGWAREAVRHSLLVTYLQANAQLQVKTGDAGLQRTPNPNDPNTPTVAPASNQTFGALL